MKRMLAVAFVIALAVGAPLFPASGQSPAGRGGDLPPDPGGVAGLRGGRRVFRLRPLQVQNILRAGAVNLSPKE